MKTGLLILILLVLIGTGVWFFWQDSVSRNTVTTPPVETFQETTTQQETTNPTPTRPVTPTPTTTPEVPESTTMCTMDVRQCADGSYVGRIPPSCSFAPCPTPPTTGK